MGFFNSLSKHQQIYVCIYIYIYIHMHLSHSQLQVLFLLIVYSFFIFNYKECNKFDLGIDYLVMSICKVGSCVVEKGYLLWPEAFSWQNSISLGKAGEDWGQKEKKASEDEMAVWHHRCNGHELGQTPADGEGQGGCSPWGRKELDTTGWLSNINMHVCIHIYVVFVERISDPCSCLCSQAMFYLTSIR